MPIVKPFKAVRPKVEFAKKITSLPYDVISEKEAREELNKNPLTFFRIGRPEIHFPEGTDPYSEKIYQKGKETIQEFLEKKYFHQDEKEHFYIYREIKGNISQTGLVSLVSVEDYDQDLIKKHELTREEKEKDRVNHIVQTRAHAEPVFLAYPDHPELSFLIKTYIENHDCVYDFEDSQGVQNTLWIIEDAHIQFMIQSIFQSDIKALYIADGHHRAKASSLTAEILKKSNPNHTGNESYNYFMAVSFPSTQLEIMAYNRVVKSSVSIQDLIEKTAQNFEISETELKNPRNKGEFILYHQGKTYLFQYKGKIPVLVSEKLDVSILQKTLLDPVLGIKNPRTDKNIDFVGGIKSFDYLKKLVDSKEFDYAFLLYPTSINDLFQIADQNEIMPPKSTWFEPKLKSGLFLHLIEE